MSHSVHFAGRNATANGNLPAGAGHRFQHIIIFALSSQYLYHRNLQNLQHNVRTIERSILDYLMFNT